MKKKKRIITIAGLLLVAIVGTTFAYYTSNTTFENVFNAGKYKVTLTEVFESPDNWVPGETVPKTVTAKNDGTVPTAVRISYTEQWLKEIDGVETDITTQVSPNPAIINFDNQDDWTSSNGYYYYKYILEPTDETSSFISGVTLDSNLDSVTCTGEGNTKTCEAQNPASGAKYKLTFTIQTVQYDQYQNVWNTNVEIIEKTSVITYLTRQVEGQITPGDIIGIGETEDFYVISSDSNKTALLSKKNLLVGFKNYLMVGYDEDSNEIWNGFYYTSNDPGYCLQTVEVQEYIGGATQYRLALPFSSSNYWDDGNGTLLSPYNENGASYEGDPSYPYVYNNSVTTLPDFNNCEWSQCWETPGYSVAYYVELYKSKLIEMGLPSTISSRLLTYEETDALQYVTDNNKSILYNDQNYWIGSAANYYNVYGVYSGMETINISNIEYNSFYDNVFGVRPVIEIPTSALQ